MANNPKCCEECFSQTLGAHSTQVTCINPSCPNCHSKEEVKPLFSKNDIRDSAQFANFAQRVKLKIWDKMMDPQDEMPAYAEKYLDEILLLAWEDFKQLIQ